MCCPILSHFLPPSLTVSGSPAPAVSWAKDGRNLHAGAGLALQQREKAHLLCLERVRKEQAGVYGCTAVNDRGTASTSWTLSVRSESNRLFYPLSSTPQSTPKEGLYLDVGNVFAEA